MVRPIRVKTTVLGHQYSCWIDKTRRNVLTYSVIAANYRSKLLEEQTWLESLIEVLKVWSSKSTLYDQEKVALVATLVEGHLRPSEFFTAIMTKSLVVEPVYMKFQRDQAAREVALANDDAVSGQLRNMVNQVFGPDLWGSFYITFTRTSLKKQWIKLKRGDSEYFER